MGLTKIFSFLPVLLISFASQAQLSDQPDYVHEWCQGVRVIVREGLNQGRAATSDAEEVAILNQAAIRALAIGNPRFQKFFQYTLRSALYDAQDVYPTDLQRQVFFMRDQLENALSDLDYLDRSWNPNNNGPYVAALLQRAQEAGRRTPLNIEEITLYRNAFHRAIYLIDESDFRRESSYACARLTLADGLSSTDNNWMTPKTKVEILRNRSETARDLIRFRRHCH